MDLWSDIHFKEFNNLPFTKWSWLIHCTTVTLEFSIVRSALMCTVFWEFLVCKLNMPYEMDRAQLIYNIDLYYSCAEVINSSSWQHSWRLW
jgi:hypothetical protein